MTTTLASIMLGTTDRDRLHTWYTSVLPPDRDQKVDDYRVLEYGGFWLFLDERDDVQASHPDPARTLLNFDVEDARSVAARMEESGATWVAPLEDRDGSLFATAQDPDGNYVQVIQLSAEARAEMADRPAEGAAGLGVGDAFSGFSVNDLDAAERFYTDVLGLAVSHPMEGMPMISVDLGGRGVLVYAKDDHAPATYTVLNFPSDDVTASVRALTERGVTFERYDGFEQDDLGISTGQGPRIAWFTDPAGNVMSVLDRTES